jgi:hypothetical protein
VKRDGAVPATGSRFPRRAKGRREALKPNRTRQRLNED